MCAPRLGGPKEAQRIEYGTIEIHFDCVIAICILCVLLSLLLFRVSNCFHFDVTAINIHINIVHAETHDFLSAKLFFPSYLQTKYFSFASKFFSLKSLNWKYYSVGCRRISTDVNAIPLSPIGKQHCFSPSLSLTLCPCNWIRKISANLDISTILKCGSISNEH